MAWGMSAVPPDFGHLSYGQVAPKTRHRADLIFERFVVSGDGIFKRAGPILRLGAKSITR